MRNNNYDTTTWARIKIIQQFGDKIHDYNFMIKLLKYITENNDPSFKEERETTMEAVKEFIAEIK